MNTPRTDVNVSLGRWPLRRLPLDETRVLVAKVRRLGFQQAWAGAFDGLLHKDMDAVNAGLDEECRARGQGVLVPFGSINPLLPGWEQDLQRCATRYRMPGIRIHPGYHGYGLSDAVAGELLRSATRLGLVVQLVVLMEDERMMHPLIRTTAVNLGPLPDLLRSVPGCRILLLNALKTLGGPTLLRLVATEQAWFDTAMLEGVGGIEAVRRHAPGIQLLHGSHAPLFYPEAALLKLRESGLPETLQSEMLAGAPARFLGKPTRA